MTACLNAANERANELFRGEKLGYLGKKKYDARYQWERFIVCYFQRHN